MLRNPLYLKEEIGSDRPVDEEDTIALKKALKQIGRYREPSYGITPYPDEPMFKAINDIQKEKGLIRDGMMKPGGETQDAINVELARTGGSGGRYPGAGLPARCRSIQSDLDQVNRDIRDFNRNGARDKAYGRSLSRRKRQLEKDLAACKWSED